MTLPNLPSGAQLPIPPLLHFFLEFLPNPSSKWSLSLYLGDDFLGATPTIQEPGGKGTGNCITNT